MDSTTFSIELDNREAGFKPGEKLSGVAEWKIPSLLSPLELKVLWFTRGKGSLDTRVVAWKRFSKPEISGREKFCFILPSGPYTFSGKLISLVWGIEIVQLNTPVFFRKEFVLSPDRTELLLGTEIC